MPTKSDNPQVAVVVVTWNGVEDTLHCLTALRQLRTPGIATVLVDNASHDGTPATVRRYFPEIAVLENATNRGYVEANNQGIAWALEAGAEWVLLLNNDVVLAPDALDELLAVSEAASGAGLGKAGILGPLMQRTLRPDIIDLGGDLDFTWGNVRLRRTTPEMAGQRWIPVDYVWGCTLLARAEVFRQVGLLDPVYVAYFEDADLCVRARKAGYRTVVALRAQSTHKVGGAGEKRYLWQTFYRLRNHALFFLRHSAGWQRLTLIPALLFYHFPFILLQSTRAYLARRLRRRKYAARPITLWGYERTLEPPQPEQIERALHDAGYFASG